MHVKDLYTIVVTDKRAACRDFYVRWFDFQVVFEAADVARLGPRWPAAEQRPLRRRFGSDAATC
jgi:hypothetical protein